MEGTGNCCDMLAVRISNVKLLTGELVVMKPLGRVPKAGDYLRFLG